MTTRAYKELTGIILLFVLDEYRDGRPKTMFGDLRDHINRKYTLERISEEEVAIHCFDLKDVGFLTIYDISNSLEKGNRPAVSITGLGIDYARIVLKPKV